MSDPDADDALLVAGLLERHTAQQLAQELIKRCACTFKHWLPSELELPEFECEYHRTRREAAAEGDQLREKLVDLLSGVALAVHGGPLENGLWSFHDLPELVAQQRKALQQVMQVLGPDAPKADEFGLDQHGAMSGMAAEIENALAAVRTAGIEYKAR